MKTAYLKRVGLAATVVVLVGSSVSAYAANKPMTSRAMVALSAKAADSKAKQDLLSILQPTHRFRTGMFASVRGMGMDTIPHGTGMKGLCTMDALIMWYTATAVKADPMNAPKRPVGISVKHLYHAAGGALAKDEGAAFLANVWSRDCTKLQSDKTATWFPAESDMEAARAVNVLLAAADAIRSGRLKAKNCDYGGGAKTCEDWILAGANVADITDVGRDCVPEPGAECLSLGLDHGLRLQISVSFDEGSVAPMEILSISAGTYVVVT